MESNKKAMLFYVSRDMKDHVETEAWKNRMSMSEYIRNLIWEDMKRKEDKK